MPLPHCHLRTVAAVAAILLLMTGNRARAIFEWSYDCKSRPDAERLHLLVRFGSGIQIKVLQASGSFTGPDGQTFALKPEEVAQAWTTKTHFNIEFGTKDSALEVSVETNCNGDTCKGRYAAKPQGELDPFEGVLICKSEEE
jgi:hypothetical protein